MHVFPLPPGNCLILWAHRPNDRLCAAILVYDWILGARPRRACRRKRKVCLVEPRNSFIIVSRPRLDTVRLMKNVQKRGRGAIFVIYWMLLQFMLSRPFEHDDGYSRDSPKITHTRASFSPFSCVFLEWSKWKVQTTQSSKRGRVFWLGPCCLAQSFVHSLYLFVTGSFSAAERSTE